MGMKRLLVMATILCGMSSVNSFAHEGHNHDAPTTLKAPKGGVIKALDESRLEVVYKGKSIKIYVYDKELKAASAKDYKIEASALMPRTKKVETIAMTAQDTFFEGHYDAKGVHRYTLKLKVTDIKAKQPYELTFTIEPRK